MGVALNVTLAPVQIAPDGVAVIIILAGTLGLTVTASGADTTPTQPTFVPFTVKFPELAPNVTVMLFVFAGTEVTLAPEGIVQIYACAPLMGVTV